MINGSRIERSGRFWLGVGIASGLLGGAACLWRFAVSLERPAGDALSVLVMLALACCAVGGLVGFLFGIPRALQGGQDQAAPSGGHNGQGSYAGRPYQANTNLEQISDWLTKILVGVGLVQIAAFPDAAGRLVGGIAVSFGDAVDQAPARLMIGSLLTFYLITGFLIGYLLTRLQLTGAFTRADIAAVREIARVAAHEQAETQQRHDEAALGVVARQLDPPPGSTAVPLAELTRVISKASPAIRSQIFTVARGVRASSTGRDAAVMGRTIPVFQALVAADPSYHRNHGQLGYALKEQDIPDLTGAEQELTEAIRLRDAAGERGWLYYELNRAVVRIVRLGTSDPTAEARESIQADVRAAMRSPETSRDLLGDERVASWLRRWAPDQVEPEHAQPRRSERVTV